MPGNRPTLQLSARWHERLAAAPETGMGYHVVTVILRNGRRHDRVVVESGAISRIDGEVSIPFLKEDIADLIVTHDRWDFGVED